MRSLVIAGAALISLGTSQIYNLPSYTTLTYKTAVYKQHPASTTLSDVIKTYWPIRHNIRITRPSAYQQYQSLALMLSMDHQLKKYYNTLIDYLPHAAAQLEQQATSTSSELGGVILAEPLEAILISDPKQPQGFKKYYPSEELIKRLEHQTRPIIAFFHTHTTAEPPTQLDLKTSIEPVGIQIVFSYEPHKTKAYLVQFGTSKIVWESNGKKQKEPEQDIQQERSFPEVPAPTIPYEGSLLVSIESANIESENTPVSVQLVEEIDTQDDNELDAELYKY